jgi:hypothetical protein
VLVFRDQATFESYLELAELVARNPLAEPVVPPHASLSFEPRAEVEEERAEEISEHRWGIAGPAAYPSSVVVDDDGIPRPPSAREVAALEAIAHALSELVETAPPLRNMLEDGEPIDEAMTLETSAGRVQITLATCDADSDFEPWENPYDDRPFDIHEALFDDGEPTRSAPTRSRRSSRASLPSRTKPRRSRPLATGSRRCSSSHGRTTPRRSLTSRVGSSRTSSRRHSAAGELRGRGAPEIVASLRAFFAFVGRAFSLTDVARCGAAVLGER